MRSWDDLYKVHSYILKIVWSMESNCIQSARQEPYNYSCKTIQAKPAVVSQVVTMQSTNKPLSVTAVLTINLMFVGWLYSVQAHHMIWNFAVPYTWHKTIICIVLKAHYTVIEVCEVVDSYMYSRGDCEQAPCTEWVWVEFCVSDCTNPWRHGPLYYNHLNYQCSYLHSLTSCGWPLRGWL